MKSNEIWIKELDTILITGNLNIFNIFAYYLFFSYKLFLTMFFNISKLMKVHQ